MVEQAHLGTTRYTTLSLSVIQVPGKPIRSASVVRVATLGARLTFATKEQNFRVYSIGLHHYQEETSPEAQGGSFPVWQK
jgi:hypothetical protein